MKISCYISAFNIDKGQFDYERCLKSCAEYFDEVVVATIKDNDDNTQNILEREARILENIKVVRSDLEQSTFLLDGKLKNVALQKCSNDICVQMDLDETPYGEIGGWDIFARRVYNSDEYDCSMLPVLNLYKTPEFYTDIAQKFRIHKKYSTHPYFFGKKLERGAFKEARLTNGGVDPKVSDTTELIHPDGSLVVCSSPSNVDIDYFKYQFPSVIHWGYVDLERRADLNKSFWKETWDGYSGEEQDVGVTIEELDGKECFRHGLDL